MTPRKYNCMSCQEPMEVSIAFQMFIQQNGNQSQRCQVCGAVHTVAQHGQVLKESGVLIARLSPVYDFPEYKPYRTGAYRVWFTLDAPPARRLTHWDGEYWTNGPIRFSDGAVKQWQGLGGDMEHTKKMPYEHDAPFPMLPEIDSCD